MRDETCLKEKSAGKIIGSRTLGLQSVGPTPPHCKCCQDEGLVWIASKDDWPIWLACACGQRTQTESRDQLTFIMSIFGPVVGLLFLLSLYLID
jgi:hypothetical protein